MTRFTGREAADVRLHLNVERRTGAAWYQAVTNQEIYAPNSNIVGGVAYNLNADGNRSSADVMTSGAANLRLINLRTGTCKRNGAACPSGRPAG